MHLRGGTAQIYGHYWPIWPRLALWFASSGHFLWRSLSALSCMEQFLVQRPASAASDAADAEVDAVLAGDQAGPPAPPAPPQPDSDSPVPPAGYEPWAAERPVWKGVSKEQWAKSQARKMTLTLKSTSDPALRLRKPLTISLLNFGRLKTCDCRYSNGGRQCSGGRATVASGAVGAGAGWV